jgi:amino acid permease
MLIIVVFLVLFFIGYSHFVGFEELEKSTWASFSIISILNGLGIFVFSFLVYYSY